MLLVEEDVPARVVLLEAREQRVRALAAPAGVPDRRRDDRWVRRCGPGEAGGEVVRGGVHS